MSRSYTFRHVPRKDLRYEPEWVNFSCKWGHAHTGRWLKRRLSKLRRKYWKDERHQRGLPGAEQECNYKNW